MAMDVDQPPPLRLSAALKLPPAIPSHRLRLVTAQGVLSATGRNPRYYDISKPTIELLYEIGIAAERSTWDHRWVGTRSRRDFVVGQTMRYGGPALDCLRDLHRGRLSIVVDSLEGAISTVESRLCTIIGDIADQLLEVLDSTPSQLIERDRSFPQAG